MSETERTYQRYVDGLVLRSAPDELRRIQEIDRRTQLSGDSFYDLYCRCTEGPILGLNEGRRPAAP
ncbi:hypothetical protein CENSYa_0814 [Cenarchaeum symbiosum A]|uniref:Uncharacterized protein n=1 Tax=Cenarchaeum symbiosum (strain A) TaxID=414004 RepID=A0RVT0_CENSY|nr:hypothetical protein CENSYa_0814 [Cenarchaeum symbiosum A]